MTDIPTPENTKSEDSSRRRILKPFLLTALGVTALAAAGAGTAAYVFLQKERDVTGFTNRILSGMDAGPQGLKLTAGQSLIAWRGPGEASVITLQDLRVMKDDTVMMQAPFAYARLDLMSLLGGSPSIESIEVHEARASLSYQNDTLFLNGPDGLQVPVSTANGNSGSGDLFPELPVEAFSLENALIEADIDRRSYSLPVEHLRLSQDGDEQRLELRAQGRAYDTPASLQFSAMRERDSGVITTEARFSGLNPGLLCNGWIDCYVMPQLDMPLEGTATATFSAQAEPLTLRFDIKGGEGLFRLQDYYPEPLALTTAVLRGSVDLTSSSATIDHFAFEMGETKTSGSFTASGSADAFSLDLKGKATNMPANDLKKYWPAGLSPMSRAWATTYVRDGIASDATITVAIRPEDLQHDYLPDHSISADVTVQDTTVEYLPGLPVAEKVSGKIHFTGTTMRATVDSASMLSGGAVSSADIHFTDLNADGTPVEIALSMEAPAADIRSFLQQAPFNPLPRLPVQFSNPRGSMAGDITLAFDAFSGGSDSDEVNWDAVSYDLKAQLKEISGISIHGLSLSGISGPLSINNTQYQGELGGRLEGSPLSFTFDLSEGKPERYALNAALPVEKLASFSPDIATYLSGTAGLKSSFSRSGERIYGMNTALDLTQAQLTLTELGYIKPVGETASATLKQQEKDQYTITYQGPDATLDGAYDGSLMPFAPQSVTISRLKAGRNDLAMTWKPMGEAFALNLSGQRLDASGILGGEDTKGGGLSDFPKILLTLDLAEIIGANNVSLRHVKGSLNCASGRCQSADLSALSEGGSMHATIGLMNGKRHLSMKASPAGPFLSWLDVTDRLQGGSLDLDGDYDDTQAHTPLNGRIRLTDFTLKDAPVLGRLLNMASFTGLVESLSTTGISFDKFKSDLVFANDVAELNELHASGPSIGVLGKAQINLDTDMIDVRGNLIPAYSINSLISHVPILGELLTGDEGGGIVGVDFRVHGDAGKPDVAVNPLSALTPGFTRKIFDVFSAPMDTDDSDNAPAPVSP
jgi:hypothetical protein